MTTILQIWLNTYVHPAELGTNQSRIPCLSCCSKELVFLYVLRRIAQTTSLYSKQRRNTNNARICCSSIFAFGTIFSEPVQNFLNQYKIFEPVQNILNWFNFFLFLFLCQTNKKNSLGTFELYPPSSPSPLYLPHFPSLLS